MSEKNQYNSQVNNEEITLKELILKIQEFSKEVFRNWKFFILFAIPVFCIGIYLHYQKPKTYTARLTFMLNEDEGGGAGGMSGLLGSVLGGGSKSTYNLDKILELSRSRKIIQTALFEKDTINGKSNFYANHLIDIYDLHNNWAKADPPTLKDFYFTHDSLPIFNRKENSVLKALHSKVIGNSQKDIKGIYASSIAKETGIMTMQIESENETMSLNFLQNFYEKLKSFYVEKTIEKQKETYVLVKRKTDSLERALNSAQYSYLKFEDSNRNLSLRQFETRKLQLQRETVALGTAYGEALRNLEMADFALKNKTPFLQEIDLPIPPLKPTRHSLPKQLIFLAIVTAFISVFFIVFRKIVRDALAN